MNSDVVFLTIFDDVPLLAEWMNLTYECPVKFDTRLSTAVAYLQLVYHRQLQPSFSDLFDVLDITKEEMKRRLIWTE